MVAKTKPWAWLVLSFLILAANCIQHCVHGKPQLRCLYIFGDSYSDNGNNNDLLTSAKSNYLPYGIDFPQGPTGRFTNGKTAIDQIAELLGIQNFPPPFANSTDSFVPEGLNYASGAAGILFETGKHRGENIHLELQVRRHEEVFNRLASKIGGPKKAKQHLKKCLYYLNIGTNDYIGNYFLPQFYDTSSTYTLEQYANILIEEYSTYIQNLRNFGAKKFVLVGIEQIGCIPYALATRGTNGSCDEEFNAAAFSFNNKLKSLVDQFNNDFSADSKFIFINSTARSTADNSTFVGFPVVNASCCPTVGNATCDPNQTPCQNRAEYVYWDGIHRTENANQIIAISSYNTSDQSFAYPTNIQSLVQS